MISWLRSGKTWESSTVSWAVTFKAEVLRGVERHHLDSHHRIETKIDSMTKHAIHVPFLDKCSGVYIIGAKNELTRIKALLCDSRNLCFNIEPRRTQTQHGTH